MAECSPGELTFTSGGGSRQRRNLVARLAAWRDKDSGEGDAPKNSQYRNRMKTRRGFSILGAGWVNPEVTVHLISRQRTIKGS